VNGGEQCRADIQTRLHCPALLVAKPVFPETESTKIFDFVFVFELSGIQSGAHGA